MSRTRRTASDLEGKVIDAHAHVGIHDGMYTKGGHPYCQSLEGLYYRQRSAGIDVNVVFPFGSHPSGAFPYERDNRRLLKEVYEQYPEHAGRFLPFLCLDPGRQVPEQIAEARDLARVYPVYGIKINPVDRGTPVRRLAESDGEAILAFAQEQNLPFIIHSAPRGVDDYSAAEDILDMAEQYPRLRFCLAHALLFCRDLLDWANRLPNVWVDTAALKIQMELTQQLCRSGVLRETRLMDVDWNDPCDGIGKLVSAYPNLIIWGTDSPAYLYRTRRRQGDQSFYDFCLKGAYEDEVSALQSLDADSMRRVSNTNTLDWLFRGRGA